jgi:hypothetical protein
MRCNTRDTTVVHVAGFAAGLRSPDMSVAAQRCGFSLRVADSDWGVTIGWP